MRAYRVVAAGRAELVEVDRPRAGPDEILLRVAAAGVCHSDVFIRQTPPALRMRLPVTLGHEVIGVIEELGAQVTGWRVGQQVAAYVLQGCGSCTPCRRGQDNLCHTGYRGLGTHFDGGMADYVVLPAGAVTDADGLDPVAAAPLTDAGLTALHAVNGLIVRDGTPARMLVIGIGGLGHLALQIAVHRCPAEIIAVDRDPQRLSLARSLGANQGVIADGSEAAAVVDLAGGREVDAVLDFVGTDATLRLAAAVTNRGAQIVVAGLGGGMLPFEALPVSTLFPEISLRRVSAGSRAELAEVLDLGRTGAVRAETITYPLEQAASAIDEVDAGTVIGRAVIIPLPIPRPELEPQMTVLPEIISVDDHVIEPANVWLDRLPARYQERGPRLVRVFGRIEPVRGGYRIVEDRDHPTARWADEWRYDDLRYVIPAGMAQVHALKNEHYHEPVTYDEMAPGCYEQSARLADMNLNHIGASLCFPTIPRFCGQTFLEREDKELALLCVRAYNDWMIDEWCAGAGYGRLIPLTLIPLWDVELAAAETRRCASKGAHAIAFSECPPYLGLPSIHSGYWDPLWKACEETDTVVNMHIGSSSTWPNTGPDSPALVPKSLSFQNSQVAFADWLASGLLEKFGTLRIALSEGQVGWIPFLAGRLDNEWELGDLFEADIRARLPRPPSSYIPGRVYGCIFDDLSGLRVRDAVGMAQIMFETDYPHGDTSFPHSQQMAEKLIANAGLDDHEAYALLRGNAIHCYRLQRYGIND